MAQSHEPTQVDTVKYILFPGLESDIEKKSNLYKEHLAPFISPYIWQSEAFNLKCDTSLGAIIGSTHFGDNIEDEWFIVFLLLELTNIDPELVIKVEDEDGEFILIEVANALPRWITPETSENRVYLHKGRLHIIPKPSPNFKHLQNGTPIVSDAVSVVRSHPDQTVALDNIQEVIMKRLDGFTEEKIKEFQHFDHCYTPYGVAAILRQEPSLLSPAIQAFYSRDPIDLKICRTMKYFPPETRVTTGVTFSRCLYAQLLHQKFIPERCVGWNIPPESSPNFKGWDLGMKLACGFEILASRCKSSDPSAPVDLNTDKQWFAFLKSLEDKNYFRGEIEGSLLYMKLLSQAKCYYLSQFVIDPLQGPEQRVKTLIQNVPYTYEELKDAEKQLPSPQEDSWLDMTMQQFDALLASKFGTNIPTEELGEKITSSLQNFLSNTSMFEGVEVPDEKPQSDGDMYKNILDFHVPGDSDHGSSSGMSDYSDDDEEPKMKDPVIKECMKQMDRQLAQTNIGKSFEKKDNDEPDIDEEDDEDGHKIVDLELNSLKNLLESYTSQHGMAGPAGNLLSSMDIKLPQNEDVDF